MLDVAGKGVTCVSQPLVIGPGMKPESLLIVNYGDYRGTYPQANAWDAPDLATASFLRTERLGFNLLVDRLGHPLEMVDFSLATPRARGRGSHEGAGGRPAGRGARKARHRAVAACKPWADTAPAESARWPS